MIPEQQAMITGLIESGDLAPDWQRCFEMVPRHKFIPDAIWIDDADGLTPLLREDDPTEWLNRAYTNDMVITQADDGATVSGEIGERVTSSASMPSVVALMLRRLDIKPCMRVLEIGTGTGWNAALLAARLGDEHVSTIEIDPVLADRARKALAGAGFQPTVATGDGTYGYPPNGSYDRIIATAACHDVPYAWVRQTWSGGLILTPWGTSYHNGALLTLTVHGDGAASGYFAGDVSFMWLRNQRAPSKWIDQYVKPDHDVTESVTDLHPYEPVGTFDGSFAVGLQLPGLIQRTIPHPDGADNHATTYVIDPEGGSWAAVDVEPDMTDALPVRQHGPRRLWDEVERAHAWWVDAGRPEHTRFGMTVTAGPQWTWLDEPTHKVSAVSA